MNVETDFIKNINFIIRFIFLLIKIKYFFLHTDLFNG